MTLNEDSSTERTISGRAVVICMFTLAIIATGTLWAYWNLHMMPFMPLQESLVAEFDHSSPRVDGGRRKTHKGTPMILRVVMRVPFDPNDSNGEIQNQIETRLNRTRQLAAEHIDIEKYEVLEVHLYEEVKEGAISQKTFTRELK